MVRALSRLGMLALLSACSSGSAGAPPSNDAGVDASPPTLDSGAVDSSGSDGSGGADSAAPDSGSDASLDAAVEAGDAAPSVIGTMGLFQLAGAVASGDAGPISAVVLEARASFHPALRARASTIGPGGVGCFTADHYDATTNPAPTRTTMRGSYA